jgi:hypothetical protein
MKEKQRSFVTLPMLGVILIIILLGLLSGCDRYNDVEVSRALDTIIVSKGFECQYVDVAEILDCTNAAARVVLSTGERMTAERPVAVGDSIRACKAEQWKGWVHCPQCTR